MQKYSGNVFNPSARRSKAPSGEMWEGMGNSGVNWWVVEWGGVKWVKCWCGRPPGAWGLGGELGGEARVGGD